jgi:hypothetical protein
MERVELQLKNYGRSRWERVVVLYRFCWRRENRICLNICIEDGVGNDSIRLATTKKEFVIQKPQNVDELSQNKSRTFNFYWDMTKLSFDC